MLIAGARVAVDSTNAVKRDLWLENGRISFSCPTSKRGPVLNAEGCLILPGLINAHDHLELNLFPRLGRGPYRNATEWAEDIYRPTVAPIKQHISVPKPLRLLWGGLRNLFSGVTTVAHHNPPYPLLFRGSFPIRVVENYRWAHSLRFSPDWQRRFAGTPAGAPFMMHAAEGTDEASAREVDTLEDARLLTSSTVLIHAVAIGPSQMDSLLRARSSLVWCPTSNHFTLGCSLARQVFDTSIPIALGTDSALTAEGDLLDELQLACRIVDAERAYRMVTTAAARILKLPIGFGEIRDQGPADLLFMPDHGATPAETMLSGLPQLVIVRGKIALRSASWVAEGRSQPFPPGYGVHLQGRGQYFTSFPMQQLFANTRAFLGEDLRLGGKKVAAA